MSWPSSDKSRTLNWRIGGCCLSFEDFFPVYCFEEPSKLATGIGEILSHNPDLVGALYRAPANFFRR
jgi:hypothetical protein